MRKNDRLVAQRKPQPKGTLRRKHIYRSRPISKAPGRTYPFSYMTALPRLKAFLASFPEGALICERGKTVWMNAAARTLFEVPDQDLKSRLDFQHFFQPCRLCDGQHQPLPPRQWLNLSSEQETTPPEKARVLHLPSGNTVSLSTWRLPLFNPQSQTTVIVCIFHELSQQEQQILHLQRVHEAIFLLIAAVAHGPEHPAPTFPQECAPLWSPVLAVAQPLVHVIHQVLDCLRVYLLALGPSTGQLYHVAESGFTDQRKQYQQKISGKFSPLAFIDDELFAPLEANKEVIFTTDQIRQPLGYRAEHVFGFNTHLAIPLFFERQLAGGLVVVKAGGEGTYSPEEIALVKAVVAQAVLIMDCLRDMYEQAESQARTLVLDEVKRLSTDFLTLASHELRTPLTGIVGNLQLAQHRLESLRQQLADQPGRVHEHITRIQQPLDAASQSARLQGRMIQDLIDDARLQANLLFLCVEPCDLRALVRAAVTEQRQSTPGRTIVLKDLSTDPAIPIIADSARLTQVLKHYLANALCAAPAEKPITVRLAVEGASARVSVHDEGPGIAPEEQESLWGRFYRAKGGGIQHELDLSLGLGFYLCRALIERHQGSVGVESEPGHGTTFWFSVPMARPADGNHSPRPG